LEIRLDSESFEPLIDFLASNRGPTNAKKILVNIYTKAAQPAARGPHAVREAVLSDPRYDKFVSRLQFIVFITGSSIFAIKTHPNYTCCFCYGPTTQNLV